MATTGAVATLQAHLPALGSAFHATTAWTRTHRDSAPGTADKVSAFSALVLSVGRALREGTLGEGRGALAIRKVADLGADVLACVPEADVHAAVSQLVEPLDAHGARAARLASHVGSSPSPRRTLTLTTSGPRRTGVEHARGPQRGYARDRSAHLGAH